MKGKKITAAFLSLAMIAGVPAAVLAEAPNETAGEEIVTEAEETEEAVETGETAVSEETEAPAEETVESGDSEESAESEDSGDAEQASVEPVVISSEANTKSYNENINYHGDIEWTYEDDGKTAILSGNGPMPDLQSMYSDSVIEQVIINHGITRIGYGSFKMHYALRKIVIPRSVTSISNYLYDEASNMQRIDLYSNPYELTWDDLKDGTVEYSSQIKIHVPEAYLDAYIAQFPKSQSLFVGDLDARLLLNINTAVGGKITTDEPVATKGSRVYLNVTTSGNYELSSVTIQDSYGGEWPVTYDGGKWFFEMPQYDVTITPYFIGDMEYVSVPFDANWRFIEWPDDATIDVTVLADGTPLNKKITLDKANPSSSFTDLPKFCEDKDINYTITAEVKGNGDFNTIITGDMTKGYHIAASKTGVVEKDVEYIDQSGHANKHDAVILTGFERTITSGWYVVKGDIDYKNTMTFTGNGDFYFILADGAVMSAGSSDKPLSVHRVIDSGKSDGDMIVFAQKNGTGAMKLYSDGTLTDATIHIRGGMQWYGGNLEVEATNLGIYYCAIPDNAKPFMIYGGTINATATGMFGCGILGKSDFYFNGGKLNATAPKTGMKIDGNPGKTVYFNSSSSADRFYTTGFSFYFEDSAKLVFNYKFEDADGNVYFGEYAGKTDNQIVNGKVITPVKDIAVTWDDLKNIIESGEYDSFSLHNNITGGPSEASAITVPASSDFTLNLNGYKIDSNKGFFDVKGSLTVTSGSVSGKSGMIEAGGTDKIFNLSGADASLKLNSVECRTYMGQGNVIRSTNGAEVILSGLTSFNAPVYLGTNTVITLADAFEAAVPVQIDLEKFGVFTKGLKGSDELASFEPLSDEYCLFISDDGEAELAEKSFIAGYKATVDGSFEMDIYVMMSKAALEASDTHVYCELPSRTVDIPLSEASTKKLGGNTYHVFTIDVSAKEFYDPIKCTLCYGDSTVELCSFDTDSYMNELSDEYEDFVYAMEFYATSACYYFGYNCSMSNPDDAEFFNGPFMSALRGMYDAIDISNLRKTNDLSGLPSGVTFEGSSIVCTSETTLKLYFKSDDDITVSINGTPADVVKLSGYQIVSIPNISPADLDSDITVTVNGGDIVVSPMTYCMQVIASEKTSVSLKALAMGMVCYNYQANKLF